MKFYEPGLYYFVNLFENLEKILENDKIVSQDTDLAEVEDNMIEDNIEVEDNMIEDSIEVVVVKKEEKIPEMVVSCVVNLQV